MLFSVATSEQIALFDPGEGAFAGDIALGGERVAISDPFFNGANGRVFVFTVPEPGSFSLLAIAGAVLCRRRRG